MSMPYAAIMRDPTLAVVKLDIQETAKHALVSKLKVYYTVPFFITFYGERTHGKKKDTYSMTVRSKTISTFPVPY